jgi:hypothetical protein
MVALENEFEESSSRSTENNTPAHSFSRSSLQGAVDYFHSSA